MVNDKLQLPVFQNGSYWSYFPYLNIDSAFPVCKLKYYCKGNNLNGTLNNHAQMEHENQGLINLEIFFSSENKTAVLISAR